MLIPMSSPRWPPTCTMCWPTTDTSWTVEVLSRWKGRGRWPPTSSPVARRVVNDRGSLTTRWLPLHWNGKDCRETERSAHRWVPGTRCSCRRDESVSCHILRLKACRELPDKWWIPVASGRKQRRLCLWAIVKVYHLESLFIFVRN